MGLKVASRLIACGFPVVGYDLDVARMRLAVDCGVEVAASAAGVATVASRVICLVDTSEQLEAVALGDSGILTAARPGDIFVAMSTIALETTCKCHRVLARQDVGFVDAPLSGGPQAASDGKLSVFVGASAVALEGCRSALEAVSERIYHLGEVGAGFAGKMVNNIAFHSLSVAVVEAMVLGLKAGLEPALMYEQLCLGTADSSALRMRGPRLLSRDFGGVPLHTAYREMVMETAFAKACGVPTPLASMAEQIYLVGMNLGLAQEDGAALVKVYEEFTGVSTADDSTL